MPFFFSIPNEVEYYSTQAEFAPCRRKDVIRSGFPKHMWLQAVKEGQVRRFYRLIYFLGVCFGTRLSFRQLDVKIS